MRSRLWIILIALSLPIFVFLGFRIYAGMIDAGGYYAAPSASMEPTLRPGEQFIVLPHTDGSVPARGTVIVYKKPGEGGTEYVKRLIGLPGETIAFRQGRPIINGEKAAWVEGEEYTMTNRTEGPVACRGAGTASGTCRVKLQRETLPSGQAHDVIDIGRSLLDDVAEVAVPEGFVFVAGDNRDNSLDSRYNSHGVVPVSAITGIAWRYAVPRTSDDGIAFNRIGAAIK